MKTCLIAIALSCATAALAQPYPSRPVRVIVPVSAGGLQDTVARAISQELAKVWGQNILVESRPGANGIIATEYVAKAAPDGYTVLMNDSAPLTINPFLYRKLPYDAVRDFAPVIGIAQVAFIMVAYAQFPPSTLQELFALARARPGEINYASYGLGSSNHLETEALGNQAGVKFTHVPYKGGADLMPAPLGAVARGADDLGIRPAGLRLARLAGMVRAGRNAAADRRQDRRRCGEDHQRAGVPGQIHQQRRPRAAQSAPRAVRRVRARGTREKPGPA
jgi:tripartite-type tricarboxylate transporter receptor subunit TctC